MNVLDAAMPDFEFLKSERGPSRHHLYLYRVGSGLFRSAIRRQIAEQGTRSGLVLSDVATYQPHRPPNEPAAPVTASLHKSVTQNSLFGESLTIHDLGHRKPRLSLSDIEEALWTVADHSATNCLCLLVPAGHKVLGIEAWRGAVEAVGLIHEPLVTPDNYLSITRAYLAQSRLGDMRSLSDNKRFLSRLRKQVEGTSCTPFELSMRADMIVLSEIEGGEFRQDDEIEEQRRERWVLPEALRRYLDRRDSSSFSSLMFLVDRLQSDRMLEPDEILTRLYRATEATLQSSDRRYRQIENPAHCIWAALLLSSETSFRRGNVFVAMEHVCQRYHRAADDGDWLSGHEGWQVIASLEGVESRQAAGRLDRARLAVQLALRNRLMNGTDAGRETLEQGGHDAGRNG